MSELEGKSILKKHYANNPEIDSSESYLTWKDMFFIEKMLNNSSESIRPLKIMFTYLKGLFIKKFAPLKNEAISITNGNDIDFQQLFSKCPELKKSKEKYVEKVYRLIILNYILHNTLFFLVVENKK